MFDVGSTLEITRRADAAGEVDSTPVLQTRMIDAGGGSGPGITPDALATVRERLASTPDPHTDAERIDLVRALEDLKNTASAVQARVTVAFAESQEAAQAARRRDVDELGKPGPKSIAAQIALARRESPHRGQRLVGLARGLTQMPHTSAALAAGVLTEHRASVLVTETNHLTAEDRAVVDSRIAGDLDDLDGLGTRALVSKARQIAYELDPEAAVDRTRRAEGERCVTLRPAPDTMAYLTALLPVAQGVSAYAALVRAADQQRVTGDPRSRGQVMADTLVARLTGRESADATPVEINLLLTDATMLSTSEEPAQLGGHGPIPAPLARRLISTAATQAEAWLRRVYADPETGQLVTMESRRRAFTKTQAEFLGLRDRTCRTPYCDAPIRHVDHVTAHAADGSTSLTNGQGLCEACNHAKRARGWRHTALPDGSVNLTTPTGHRHRSRAPAPPGSA